MKTYSVPITAFCTVVIEADSEEEAMTVACDNVSMGDFQINEGGPALEIIGEEEIKQEKRHADRVMEI